MDNQPETILVELIRYNNWANHQVLQAYQSLSENQLDTAFGSLGLPIPEVDGWGYMEARPEKFEVKSGSR